MKTKCLLIVAALFCCAINLFSQNVSVVCLKAESKEFYDRMKSYDAQDQTGLKLTIEDWDVSVVDLMEDVEELYGNLQELYNSSGGFEVESLAIPNTTNRLRTKWRLLKLKMLEHECILAPDNMYLSGLLAKCRDEFSEWYRNAYVAD